MQAPSFLRALWPFATLGVAFAATLACVPTPGLAQAGPASASPVAPTGASAASVASAATAATPQAPVHNFTAPRVAASKRSVQAVSDGGTPIGFMSRENFTYRADNKRLSEVLQDFAASQRLPAVVADGLVGTVSGNFDMPAIGFLDTMSKAFGVLWYHDGSALYFYPSSAVQSRMFRLQGFSRQQVSDLLKSLELGDARYPLRYNEEHRTLVVVGPPRHVELVSQAIEVLDAGAVAEGGKRTVRVFSLRYASASDRVLGESTIPGVATVLRTVFGGRSGGSGPMATAQSTANSAQMSGRMKAMQALIGPNKMSPDAAAREGSLSPAAKLPGTQGGPSARGIASPLETEDDEPRFEADEGTNTVIVQGSGARMRDYEALIRRLDQKPVLVEFEAMIVDVSADSVRTLGVDWSASGATKAGSVTSPFSSPVGGGLPVALASGAFQLGTVIRDAGREFVMRVQALQGEGKARIVSKPSVLGVANRPAVMRDRRIASVSVAGNLEANLFQVEAGTILQVTPQVSSADGVNWIKLSLYIEDGSFESTIVDKVPVVKRTEIRTEAHVREGESLLIGGITVESDTLQDNGVPGLSKVPLLGGLFSSVNSRRTRTERMFLITPRLRGTLTGAPDGEQPIAVAPKALP